VVCVHEATFALGKVVSSFRFFCFSAAETEVCVFISLASTTSNLHALTYKIINKYKGMLVCVNARAPVLGLCFLVSVRLILTP